MTLPAIRKQRIAVALGCALLAVMTGCASNRAKISYSSPPIAPSSHGLSLASPDGSARMTPLDTAALTDNLQNALVADRRVRATNVSVSVTGHVVTLYGVVNSEGAKEAAYQDCFREQGVEEVINQISVEPEG